MLYQVDSSTSHSGRDLLPIDLHLPKSLLLTTGLVIIITQPIWLAIEGQLSRALSTGSQPFEFSLLVGFSLFNLGLGLTFLSIVRFRWLRLRWRKLTLLVWTSLILSGAITTRQTGQVEA